MIQWMLAIWSLVPLPFLKPAWTSGSSRFMYCWSLAQSCPHLCDPMDCIMPGFPALYHLLEFAQTHVDWVSDAMQPSHPVSSPFCPAVNLSASESFPMNRLFTSGGQSTRASASASVLPMNIRGWFPLGLTGLISLLFKGLSRVFSINFSALSFLCDSTENPHSKN